MGGRASARPMFPVPLMFGICRRTPLRWRAGFAEPPLHWEVETLLPHSGSISVLSQLWQSRWDEGAAAHLLSRAGFGGTPEEAAAVQAKGLAQAVHDLVEPDTSAFALQPPDWAHPRDLRVVRMEARAAKRDGDKTKIQAERKMEGDELLDLRRWWLGWMGVTPAPLVEKMTLFWHGHFATSAEKVKDGYWIWRQNDTLRRYALGNFVALTKAMSRDPAMMIYLDLPQSRREHPNENWARELMELFTVGIGNYSEQDVRESARAFTGYRLNPATQQFYFARGQHDAGPKTFLGRKGNFNGDDVIDILTKQPACSQFIGKKLCRYFIADEPAPSLVDAVAGSLRTHNFEIKPVLREIFSSAEFYAQANVRTQIKSPTQYVVQTCKLLNCELPAPPIAQAAMRQMGQLLFAPPNVKGWDGGKSWISTSTLLFRNNFANYLINGDSMVPEAARGKGGDPGVKAGARAAMRQQFHRDPINVATIAPPEMRESPDKLLAHLSRRFLQTEPEAQDREAFSKFLAARNGDTGDATVRGLLHLMMSTPEYQLT
jgi:uncharacterized protein (DUF1800 family)